MKFSEELEKKINLIFNNDKEIREQLLAGKSDAISQIGLMSQIGINPEDVVDAYESNDSDTMKYLYNKAKKMLELQELYKALCLEYSKQAIQKPYIDR